MITTIVFLSLSVPMQVAPAEASTATEAAASQQSAGDQLASEGEVEELLVKLFSEKILSEEKLRELLPRFSKFSSNKVWLMTYALDYKQWDGDTVIEMLPKFEEASAMEVRIRMRVANEDIAYVKKLAKASEKSRSHQLAEANKARQKMIADRDYYRDRKIEQRPSFRVSR